MAGGMGFEGWKEDSVELDEIGGTTKFLEEGCQEWIKV